MKFFVATKHTQGSDLRDFCFCSEGEIVHYSSDWDYPYLVGVDSLKGTTTLMIKDGFSIEHIVEQITKSYKREYGIHMMESNEGLMADVLNEVKDLAYYASLYNDGDIVAKSTQGVFLMRTNVSRLNCVDAVDAITNVLRMIEGAKTAKWWHRQPESVLALYDEISEELQRGLPATVKDPTAAEGE